MNKRSGNVDLVKFIAALLIMTHHLYNLSIDFRCPFYDSWIYVEFFLIITGYYTAKHYDGFIAKNISKEAIEYTIKKIQPLLPYTMSVSTLAWITQGIIQMKNAGWSLKVFIATFLGDFSFDLLLISDSYTYPLVVPIWYVSSLFIVFPLFIVFVQIMDRYTKIILCIIVPLLYYGWVGVTGNRSFPHDMLRVFVGMMLGVLIYEAYIVFKDSICKIPKIILTFIEFVCWVYPIICSYKNYALYGITTYRLYLLCFLIEGLICLSGISYSCRINGKLYNYLGRLSMPIFVVHWYVGTLISNFAMIFKWNVMLKIVLYYIATILISVIFMIIVEKCKILQKIVKTSIVLPYK